MTEPKAQDELASASDALRAAEALLDLDLLRDAMSRAYYAAFHAARALVLAEGFEAKSHGGLMHLFNLHVVGQGRLEPRFNLLLARLQAYRHASDYGYAFAMARDDVEAEIAAAGEIVERAYSLLSP